MISPVILLQPLWIRMEIQKNLFPSEEPVTIEIERGVGQEIPCTITKAIAPGDRIRLLYKSSDGSEWKWVRGGGDTTGEIVVAADPTSTGRNLFGYECLCLSLRGWCTAYVISSSCTILEVALYDMNGRLLKSK